jgi:signal transduction histidine kinase
MTADRPPHALPVWRRLHVRAALVAAPLLMLLGVIMLLLLQHYSAQNALEASQRMNLGLARYVAEHQEPGLLNAGGRPDRSRVEELSMHVMKINPAVEVYFLDPQGRVQAHALEGLEGPNPVGTLVDLQPVRQLLEPVPGTVTRLPLMGSDPIQPGQRNTFSVAPLRSSAGTIDGYLYIVLNGRKVQGGAASLANSHTLQAMAMATAAVSALAALVLWMAWRHLTRPLRQLTDELCAFRGAGSTPVDASQGDEIGVLRGSVRDMQHRIAQQFQQLDDSDRQRRELVSNISHDLRTPLSNIRGYVETVMLRGDSLDADSRTSHLRTALRHADLLGKRVADLFELSKLDAGRVEPQREVFCLAELLQDVVQNYRLAAQQRGVTVQLSTGNHAKARVLADIAMIERVLQNLIDNALRHTVSGGFVSIAIENRGEFMEISVSDTGSGIRSEHLPHIFERYWRAADVEDHAANTSSGLGLAIVKRILDLHGSAVQVHSELMRGTRFHFALRRAA